MTMASRGMGKARKTPSKKISNPMDKMSVGAATTKNDITGMSCGGKAYKSGGVVDGCAQRGKTKGRLV